MNKVLEIGLEATSQIRVTKELLARNVGSGTLDVYATPAMIALMENAAMKAVEACLEEGTDTVGIEINVQHIAASKEGVLITARARLVELSKKILTFEVEAWDEDKQIGKARHKRAIVEVEKFLSRV